MSLVSDQNPRLLTTVAASALCRDRVIMRGGKNLTRNTKYGDFFILPLKQMLDI